ncbi:hypothetical protein MMC12_003212 [Toensbergia leucococca]|nr:hypothetical protein [Toensbergia leucococca]
MSPSSFKGAKKLSLSAFIGPEEEKVDRAEDAAASAAGLHQQHNPESSPRYTSGAPSRRRSSPEQSKM